MFPKIEGLKLSFPTPCTEPLTIFPFSFPLAQTLLAADFSHCPTFTNNHPPLLSSAVTDFRDSLSIDRRDCFRVELDFL
ncbi:hypothetical protein AAHA92_13240 [Salvia divinorum]|uniref:Uncharacterized protein n=1 Tax=Salvia divinorum TaxID=28513 RepID=A0ABD1H7N8_SALDI